MSDDLLCVGTIAGAFGVRGEVRLKSFTSAPHAIADLAPLVREDGVQEFDVVITGQTKNGLTARMSGIVSKEEADAKKGTKLFVPRSRLPDLPDDEYYYSDLEGLEVFDTGGAPLGQVKSVHNHGASDLLEIKLPNSNATVLLPFTNAAVPTVDLKLGRIVADPPLGIFPEQE